MNNEIQQGHFVNELQRSIRNINQLLTFVNPGDNSKKFHVISITAQSSKKIPKKWLCVGARAPTHNQFLGYLWQ
jgi:hypothetical protein